MEVGLGGRLDATNVLDPDVTVITPISYDHVAILGDTLALIAAEKAGIIKPGVPVVSAPQPDEALATIRDVCDSQGAPLTLLGRDWTWQSGRGQISTGRRSPSAMENTTVSSLHLPLLGEHQLDNATTAAAVLSVLEQGGLDCPGLGVAGGLAGCTLARPTRDPGARTVGRSGWCPQRRFGAQADRRAPRHG